MSTLNPGNGWAVPSPVIALFPELPSDLYGDYCDAYEHVGQHGGADYHGSSDTPRHVRRTKLPTLPPNYGPSAYSLRPVKRAIEDITTHVAGLHWTFGTPCKPTIPIGEKIMTTTTTPKFNPEEFSWPRRGPPRRFRRNDQTPFEFLKRHLAGDWGEELCQEDRQANDQALVDGCRLFSAYSSRMDQDLDITEAGR